jgi:hypothetical protein
MVNLNDFSWRHRVAAWEGALQMIGERPLLGFGWNRPEAEYETFHKPMQVSEGAAIQLNDYLLLGATLGIPALFCFGMYLWLALAGKARSGTAFAALPRVEKRNSDESRARAETEERDREPTEEGRIRNEEVNCETGAGGRAKISEGEWMKVVCRAGAIVLAVGFWFDGGLFKLPTASTFWILLELGRET